MRSVARCVPPEQLAWPTERYLEGVSEHLEPSSAHDDVARTWSERRAVRLAKTSGRVVGERVKSAFTARGGGFMRLAQSHAAAVAGDTLVAVALAGTLFFSVPSAEARQNVALYLMLTLAPFAVIGPLLGRVYERLPAAYRGGLVVSAALRAVIAITMIPLLDTVFLFPLAFVLLVLSRFHGISRSSVLPVVLDRPFELVAANAELARLGVFGSVFAAPIAGVAAWLDAPWLALIATAVAFVWSTSAALWLPSLNLVRRSHSGTQPRSGGATPRVIRLARFATAAVRFLNGFLLLLVAFAFRDVDAGAADFAALLGAAGVGYLLAAFATPVLERRISEEPMVVTGLAVEAGAAFVAAQYFGLPAASLLAGAAGLAWGTAKFGFDGLLQATLPTSQRGRAFTNSETMFQIAWVLGAVIPVLGSPPVELGLLAAGLAALFIQVVYISAMLVPVAAARRQVIALQEAEEDAAAGPAPPDGDVLDFF